MTKNKDEERTSALTCAFTGHRPQRLSFGFNEADRRCGQLKAALWTEIAALLKNGVSRFLSGMAQGVDTYAAEIILDLKHAPRYKAELECVLPCATQTRNWSPRAQRRYEQILKSADAVTYVQREYDKNCMFRRDKFLVDNADVLVALWDGSRSGTGYTVEYALQQNVPRVIIHPDTLEVRREGDFSALGT